MQTKDILKELRKSRGYHNARGFCEILGISYNTYQNYETGKRIPTADILIKLADFYGVSTDELLGRSPPETKPDPIDLLQIGELEKAIVRSYIALSPRKRTEFVNILQQIADGADIEITFKSKADGKEYHEVTANEVLPASEEEAKKGVV